MNDDFVRVTQRCNEMWAARRGARDRPLLAFKAKSHAVAYGRAISFSRKLALFVDDKGGTAVRQSSSSLTYPILLE